MRVSPTTITDSVQQWQEAALEEFLLRTAETKGARHPSYFNCDAKRDGPVGYGVSARTAGSCGRDRPEHSEETKGRHERRKASEEEGSAFILRAPFKND